MAEYATGLALARELGNFLKPHQRFCAKAKTVRGPSMSALKPPDGTIIRIRFIAEHIIGAEACVV